VGYPTRKLTAFENIGRGMYRGLFCFKGSTRGRTKWQHQRYERGLISVEQNDQIEGVLIHDKFKEVPWKKIVRINTHDFNHQKRRNCPEASLRN